MQVSEKYAIDKPFEAQHVYRTTDPQHPGVAKVLDQGDVTLAGRVRVLSAGEYPVKYPNLYIRPAEARAMFLETGCWRVAAFHRRTPMPRRHQYLAKLTVAVSDSIFILPFPWR